MFVSTVTRAAACPSCGAYGGSAHTFACSGQATFHGLMRRAPQSAVWSRIARTGDGKTGDFLAMRLDN